MRKREAKMRRYVLTMLSVLALASGCGEQDNANELQPIQLPNMYDDDPLSRKVVLAMCGKAEDRAFAISSLAEPTKEGDLSQDIYDVATQVAERGCPKPTR